MSSKAKTIIKIAVVGGLLVFAAVLVFTRLRSSMRVGEEGAQAWFYDESERELYTASRDTIPPHAGNGGRDGDGVRAVVVAPAGSKDSAQRRIAYLETSTPELKQLQEGLRAARRAGRVYDKPMPDPESDFFDKNTLVRRPNEDAWHDMTTGDARQIVNEWRGWRGPNGSPLVVVVP